MRYTFIISVLMYGLLLCNVDIIDSIINKQFVNNKQCSSQNSNATDKLYEDALYLKTLRLQKYKHTRNNIILIKQRCSSLCETDLLLAKNVKNGSLYQHVEKNLNCTGLWNDSIFDEPSKFKDPVQKIPKYLIDAFSHKGRVKITSYYYAEEAAENHTSNAWGMLHSLLNNNNILFRGLF